MFLLPFLGLWVRYIFVYRFNWKKMDNARRINEDIENYKDVKAGAIGFVMIVTVLVLYQILSGKVAFL